MTALRIQPERLTAKFLESKSIQGENYAADTKSYSEPLCAIFGARAVAKKSE
ncbi:hypothetical protein [Rhizobium sp. RU36D]|uniref:hypothetical protein n=1 Tax=Rhizobium sp. RU36D TaxID=1907415 RepID=UPI0015C4D537|nr:hypothetical protein [Rhizobium sp. RU36D]